MTHPPLRVVSMHATYQPGVCRGHLSWQGAFQSLKRGLPQQGMIHGWILCQGASAPATRQPAQDMRLLRCSGGAWGPHGMAWLGFPCGLSESQGGGSCRGRTPSIHVPLHWSPVLHCRCLRPLGKVRRAGVGWLSRH